MKRAESLEDLLSYDILKIIKKRFSTKKTVKVEVQSQENHHKKKLMIRLRCGSSSHMKIFLFPSGNDGLVNAKASMAEIESFVTDFMNGIGK